MIPEYYILQTRKVNGLTKVVGKSDIVIWIRLDGTRTTNLEYLKLRVRR